MFYFGKKHAAPIYENIPSVSTTPIGIPCSWCEEKIEKDDDGFVLPALERTGKAGLTFFHRACFIRQFMGSISHLKGLCSCYVSDSVCGDPPGLSLRQAAEEVLKFIERRKVQ